jgi:transcriptional regulator with XRE-family HTH domain
MTKFQEFMNSQGLTQYRLHKLTGFTKSQISEWQRCKHRPSLKSAQRIAFTLHLSLQDLKSQIELRENCQNAISPDGQFVARTRKNSIAIGETNDAIRMGPAYCTLCHQILRKAA